MLLRPTDSVPTEILMLDHSCFPLLCINALQQHEQRLRAVECAVGAVAEQLRDFGSLGVPSERAGLAWREAAVEQAVFSALKKKQAEPRGGLVAVGRQLWRRCRTLKMGRSTIHIKMAVENPKAA